MNQLALVGLLFLSASLTATASHAAEFAGTIKLRSVVRETGVSTILIGAAKGTLTVDVAQGYDNPDARFDIIGDDCDEWFRAGITANLPVYLHAKGDFKQGGLFVAKKLLHCGLKRQLE